ncbi:MAG: membrane integrity-associated transporter subunit PqiC [Rhodoferax sp.]|nr:membrane integrity-associated transporter subunit PqiC [Rhodoferax sp.]
MMFVHTLFWRCGAAAALLVLGACSALSPSVTAPPSFYVLESPASVAPASMPAVAPTLIINPTHAAAGFGSARIIYVREAHRLDYFAHSEWVDPPARMLTPLLVSAIEGAGAFRAVVATPSAAAADLRLDTEIVRLQHEFQSRPSRVRFTLRVDLVDDKTRRVVARREFDASVAAASDDAYGGVVAANRAVQTTLKELAAFVAATVRGGSESK